MICTLLNVCQVDAPIKVRTFLLKLLSWKDSTHTIPTRIYQVQLRKTTKIESVLKRIRWKALQFLGKLVSSKKEKYGLKSRKYLQTIDELIDFEDSLSSLTINIEFSNVSNTFQEQLANDIK